jgi:hypothetical protein
MFELHARSFPFLVPALLWGCSNASSSGSASQQAPGSAGRSSAAAPSPFRVFASSVDGPVKAGTSVTASAACPDAMVLVGGGVSADLTTGKAPSPSIRLHGTFPRGASGHPASGNRPFSWAAVGATGGQDEKNGRTTGFAVCAKGGPADALVAVASVPGPTKAGSAARATATCPKGMGLTGGGGDVTMKDGSTPPRHYFVAGSFPSTTEGVPAAGGSAAASWTTVGAIGGMPLQGGR